MVRASRTVTQTQPETEAGYYSYDFGKRRIGRNWDSDGWTWSVYGQDSVVSEYDSTGNQQNRYEYANGMVVRGEQDGYYFSDAQGSVTFVAGTEPQVTRTEYDPWGVILSGARDGSTISYTGQWRDDQTGLMPLGNGERYYDPLLGRFIQEDSFAGMYTLPISLNRYLYGHDNPLVYFDPTGMTAEMAARGETHELFMHWSNQSGFWNQVGGWGGLALYEVANTITFGAVEREDRTWTAFGSGKISGGEATFRSVANISLSTVHLVASAATGGISLLAEAGIFAGLTAVQQFGIENYEMAYEGRQSLSSLEDYVVNAAFAGGMTIGLGFVGRVANQARVMSQAKTIKEGVEVPHGMLDLLTGAAKKVVHQELALMSQELQPVKQLGSSLGKAQSVFNELNPQTVAVDEEAFSLLTSESGVWRKIARLHGPGGDVPLEQLIATRKAMLEEAKLTFKNFTGGKEFKHLKIKGKRVKVIRPQEGELVKSIPVASPDPRVPVPIATRAIEFNPSKGGIVYGRKLTADEFLQVYIHEATHLKRMDVGRLTKTNVYEEFLAHMNEFRWQVGRKATRQEARAIYARTVSNYRDLYGGRMGSIPFKDRR